MLKFIKVIFIFVGDDQMGRRAAFKIRFEPSIAASFRQKLYAEAEIVPAWYFTVREGRKEALKQFPESALRLFGIEEKDPLLSPIGALLRYIEDNTKTEMPQLRAIERINDESYLLLDSAAVRNLELIASLQDGRSQGSLFHALNRTKTASGGRFLKDAILHPLEDKSAIDKRLDWVSFFHGNRKETERVRDILSSASDLERLSAKATLRKLTPRDMIAIADTTASFFSLVSEREEYLALADDFSVLADKPVFDIRSPEVDPDVCLFIHFYHSKHACRLKYGKHCPLVSVPCIFRPVPGHKSLFPLHS